jgi:hypothetical protein
MLGVLNRLIAESHFVLVRWHRCSCEGEIARKRASYSSTASRFRVSQIVAEPESSREAAKGANVGRIQDSHWPEKVARVDS